MIAIVTLLLVLYLSLLITRIATIALTHTGISKQTARFQARSALSGCGFTTSESEKMVNHPVRRKILMLLMLFGNVGVVAALTSLVLGFVKTGTGVDSFYVKALILLGGLSLLWYVSKSSTVDRQLSRVIDWALRRYSDLDIRDYAHLFHFADDYKLVEILIKPENWVAQRKVNELNLRSEGIVLLGIQRVTGEYIGAPLGETVIVPNDTLIIYGKKERIASLNARKAGTVGDREHEDAILEQDKTVMAEKKINS